LGNPSYDNFLKKINKFVLFFLFLIFETLNLKLHIYNYDFVRLLCRFLWSQPEEIVGNSIADLKAGDRARKGG
jgi:hypothetical protein